jgi:hypothetical protein
MTTKPAPQRLVLTERDIAIFKSLSEARCLEVESVEWLHYPTWRERWEVAQQVGKKHKPTTQAYIRLARFAEARLVQQVQRPVARAVSRYGRDTHVYLLTRLGAEYLADATGQPIETINYSRERGRAITHLEHMVTVGRFYAAMRTRVESWQGLRFIGWQSDYELSRGNYDRVEARVEHRDGSTHRKRLPVLPDGAFYIENKEGRFLFFLEVDRGRHASTWKEKISAYEAYVRSQELQTRYGVKDFILLAVTTIAPQRKRLLETTAQINRDPGVRYLFGLEDVLHPATIGGMWQKIDKTTLERRWVAGQTRQVMRVEPVQHVLLK